MTRGIVAALALSVAFLAPAGAEARISFTVGDNVYADGQWFTVEEYEQYKATHPADGTPAPAAPTEAAAAAPMEPPAPAPVPAAGGPPLVTIAPPPVTAPLAIGAAAAPPPVAAAATPAPALQSAAAPAPTLRAASCKTLWFYAEFPGESEKFDCGPLGQLTRQQMLSQGWKIDFVEKLPAVAGQATPNAYKIILSR